MFVSLTFLYDPCQDIVATCVNPVATLPNHASWKRISCLVELLRVRLLKPTTLADVAAAMPDLAFSLLMVAGLGAPEVRAAVQGLTIATVRAAVAMSVRDDVDKNRKRTGFLLELQGLQLFQRSEPTTNKKRIEVHRETLHRVEQFWAVAVSILEWCAPNNGMSGLHSEEIPCD